MAEPRRRRPPGALDVDPGRPPVVIPSLVLHEIFQHALEAYPDQECCGLVTGTARQRYRRAWRCWNAQNRYHHRDPARFPRNARSAFRVPDPDLQRIEQEAAQEGEEVTAIYHSHPDWEACFSADDRRYAEDPEFPFPAADHVVVSVLGDHDARGGVRARRVAGVGVFRRLPGERVFVGLPVEPGGP